MQEKENTFLTILERYKGLIYKVAYAYCRDRSDQDDLIQEITIQLWLSLENYNGKYKWSTWIYRVALNSSISFYRKNKKRRERTTALHPIIEVSAIEEEQPDNEDFVLLQHFIRELKELDRALILLHLDGLSSHEIAEIMETTQTNVTTKIYRIKKLLKEKFKQYKKV